jgi:hypothetical protein
VHGQGELLAPLDVRLVSMSVSGPARMLGGSSTSTVHAGGDEFGLMFSGIQ